MMILWYSMNVYNWILVGTIDMLVYFGNNNEQHRQLDIHSTKYIVPLFLIFVGMISVHPHVVIKAVHLGVFCVAVVGYYVNW